MFGLSHSAVRAVPKCREHATQLCQELRTETFFFKLKSTKTELSSAAPTVRFFERQLVDKCSQSLKDFVVTNRLSVAIHLEKRAKD